MKIKISVLFILIASALFAAPPTKEQVDFALKSVKAHLADTLKNPDSYKGGEWSIWIGKDKDNKDCLRVWHDYQAMNGFGGYSPGNLVCAFIGEEWIFVSLQNIKSAMAYDQKQVGATIFKNTEKELKGLPKEDFVKIQPKRTLGGEEVK